jgi:hypothetical protein
MPGRCTGWILAVLLVCAGNTAQAQVDPIKRQLLQFGYNQPLEGRGPIAGYAFYFLNRPGYLRTNLTLRLAVAPVYADAELGIKGLLGRHTDLGIGIAGGGFADTHQEVRGGRYLDGESFTGHGAEISAAIYHLLNPGKRIPLHLVGRVAGHFTQYIHDSDVAPGFEIPDDRRSLRLRAGFRLGGREPLLTPALALEFSGWYEARLHDTEGAYGFGGDRLAEATVHLFRSRALLAYTFPGRGDYLTASVTAGASLNQDRLNAFQMGGALPLSSEFPLTLPGYYFGEISARRFILLGGLYASPVGPSKRWTLNGFATTAFVQYVPGMRQPGNSHTGLGAGLGYRSQENVWQMILSYGYGVDALRPNHRGAHAVGLLLQYDLEARHRLRPTFEPGIGPDKTRALERFIRRLNIFK